MRAAVLLCALLWSLVDCQPTAPYVSFNNMNLLNHGYVDLSLVGDAEDGSDSVQCHTDLTTCCTSGLSSADRPDWYFPNGTEMRFEGDGDDIYHRRVAQRNDLRRRNNALSPSGIYRCEIPTDDGDLVRETVYVGIYGSGGAVTTSGDVEFAMISDDEFTLTCISTGGPATTVTWTRDSEAAVGVRRSEIVNRETAEYTNTLTVTGRLPGLYTCTVTNDVTPAGVSASITVQVTSAPTNVIAVQEGPDGIRVTWTPSSDANGYIISYDNGAGSVTVDGGSTDSHTRMDLQNGDTYTISIVATSATSFPSDSVAADMTVSLVPARPSINMNPPTTATSISLSWSVPDSVVTSSVVSWQRDTSVGCPDEDEGSTPVTGSSTSTTLSGRQEDSIYFITVTAFNDAGESKVSSTVVAVTMEAAPSAAPTPVSATRTSTIITVQWGPVECIHRNGDITGYSVQYWIQGQSTQTISVPGDSSGGSYEITGLQSSTTYSIQVAAITGASRVGPYSSTITEVTSGGVALSVGSISTRSMTISWTLAEGVTATSYTISYENTNTECFTMTYADITTSEMTVDLTGLEEGTEYSITVTTTLSGGGGGTVSDTQIATTRPVAPSAPPDSVRLSVVSSTAIIVQWGMVPCIHRNGDITGYSVQYTGGGSIQTMSVTGGDATMTTIEGLRPSTTYSIVMAAVNDVDTGEYSAPMTIQTPESVFLKLGSEVIPNHGHVVISDIGTSMTDIDSLLCITDGVANTGDMNTEGNWFAPDGTRVNLLDVPGVRRNKDDMVVRLIRTTATGTPEEGIYHCMVQDATRVFQTVYVGLYNSGGGIVDVQSLVFSQASPQFTLTCISTGGPATTVTWTRDSQTAVGERKSEVVNGVTAQYANTLTVTGRLGGLYTCTVTNEVAPSGASESFTVSVASAPTNVMAEQEGLTDIRVTWTPSTGADGYVISYSNGSSSDSVTVSDGSTREQLLTDLLNGATYTISVIATSQQQLPSEAVDIEDDIMLVPPPHMPTVDIETADLGSTSISLSWTVPEDTVVTNSLVMWGLASSGGSSARAVRDDGSGSSGLITGTSYTITGLRRSTSYLITIILINPAGNSSMQITLSTTEAKPGTDSSTSTISLLEAIIGEVVMAVIVVMVIVIVIVVLVMRKHRVPTEVQKRDDIPIATNEAYHTVSHAKAAEADYEQIGLDVIPTSRERTTDYETPHTVPPSTSPSSQPPTAGDYEQV